MDAQQTTGQPPPVYAASQPQILVAPLPDSASFFSGQTVQGEVFVKGLGEQGAQRGVKELSVQLYLINRLPDLPDIDLHHFAPSTLWPPASSSSASSSSFSSVHSFSIPLPSSGLPGTLNLTDSRKGEVLWSLRVSLILGSGTIKEEVIVEGTPQELESDELEGEGKGEVEAVLDKRGVVARLLVDDPVPRLGSLLRLGVELRPKERQRTRVAGLASQPDPGQTLRALRRLRVELYRHISIPPLPSSSASSDTPTIDHLTLLHASGKSLRYPGSSHPPLRLLFTLPTAQLGSIVDQTWGETSISTPYHTVTFFIRVILGFGALAEVAPEEMRDFILEQKITIRPRLYRTRNPISLESLSDGAVDGLSEEELAREAYRRKGLDVVGHQGTLRVEGEEGPPAFDEPGPSRPPVHATGSDLPTFLESEAAAAGDAPYAMSDEERATAVGRRGSLGGELGTWIEYDGYETFSVAPPSAAVSFGASGSMDPPQPDDEHDVNVAGGLAARLGLGAQPGVGGMELMEQLGLGEGTRVIDLQDDLPPGIDEPSLPALPDFSHPSYPSNRYRPSHSHPHSSETLQTPSSGISHDISPPSFAASEAAHTRPPQAGSIVHPPRDVTESTEMMRRASAHEGVTPPPPIEAHQGREDPPGYFGQAAGGPPAYS